MIHVSRFSLADFDEIELNERQRHNPLGLDNRDALAMLERSGSCFTVRNPQGRILMCGGGCENHEDHVTTWSVFAHRIDHRKGLARVVMNYFASLPHRRVDAMIRADDEIAQRWALFLNFEAEAVLADYCADGGAMMIFRWKGQA